MGHIYYEFRVHLRYIEPEIWRSFILPADASFQDLHLAIQDAFGWQQAHLYEFMRQFKRSAQTIAGIPKEMRTFGGSAGTPDAAEVGLWSYFDALPSCLYLYDFGDSWEHHVQRVRTFEETKERKTFRELTGGAYAGPPEDCGGVWGYETIAEFVRTGEVSDGWTKEELGGWLGDWDPDRFDLKTAKRVFGAASRVSRIPREEVAAAEVDFKDRSHLHKKHQQVFELLTDHMVAGGLDDQTIEHAHSMFEDFLEAADPPPRKPAIYAAAIEYILRGFYDNFWDRAELSQQDLADVYGTSTMSISKAYREIEEALDLEHNDPRYFTSSEKSVDDFMREFFFDAAPMPEFPAELGIIPAPILSTLSMLPRSSEAWEIARSALPSSYQGDGSHACVLHDTEDNGLYIIKEGVAIPPEIVAIVDAAMRLEHLPSHLTVSPAADDETLRTFLDFLGIGLAVGDCHIASRADVDDLYLASESNFRREIEDDQELTSATAREIYNVSRQLWKLAPWRHVLDTQLIAIESSREGAPPMTVSVVGNIDESAGILIFTSFEDWERFFELAVDSYPSAENIRLLPRVHCLNFEDYDELPEEIMFDIARAYDVELDEIEEAFPLFPLPSMMLDGNLHEPSQPEGELILDAVRGVVTLFEDHPELAARNASPKPTRITTIERDGISVKAIAPHPRLQRFLERLDFDDHPWFIT